MHPREVFKAAVLSNAASIILFHNHPSGDPAPSSEDQTATERIRDCGRLMGIDLLDHIIIGENTYYSMREKGDI
nr:JAB domain-containing protein [Proteiniclasticum ruminis]